MQSRLVYGLATVLAATALHASHYSVEAFILHRPFLPMTMRPSGKESRLRVVSTDAEETGTVGTTNPRTEGLALMLDDGTRKSHSLAENTAFVSGFFKGLSTQQAYRNLLTSLYFVYRAMENAFDDDDDVDVRVKALDDPRLRRLAALEEDMGYFYGSDWQQQITPSPATAAYVSRINALASDKQKGFLFVGHQYSRYLGDLFGGQMMGSMARRSLDLTNTDGTAFYEFDEISDTTDFITQWYQTLNRLDLTNSQKEEIVKEANYVFALNIALFDELEGSPFQAMWTLMVSSIKMKLGLA